MSTTGETTTTLADGGGGGGEGGEGGLVACHLVTFNVQWKDGGRKVKKWTQSRNARQFSCTEFCSNLLYPT
jgi:hypothetical protein